MLLDEYGAAARLNVKVRQVRLWADAEILPGVRLPDGTLRFDPQRLDEWVAGRGPAVPDTGRTVPQPEC